MSKSDHRHGQTRTTARGRLKKIIRRSLRVTVIALAVLNVLLILPGMVMGIWMHEPTPVITLPLLSIAVWAVAFGLVQLLRWHRPQSRAALPR